MNLRVATMILLGTRVADGWLVAIWDPVGHGCKRGVSCSVTGSKLWV